MKAWLIAVLLGATSAWGEPLLVEVFTDHGDTMIRAGKAEGLKTGQSVPMVGATISGSIERRQLGAAVVLQVYDHLARVSLDEQVESYQGKKWAMIAAEAVADPTPAASKPAPRTFPDKPLKGKAEKDHKFLFKKQLVLTNEDTFPWTNCELQLNTNGVARSINVAAGADYVISLASFKADQGEPLDVPVDALDVRCNEGTTRFLLGH